MIPTKREDNNVLLSLSSEQWTKEEQSDPIRLFTEGRLIRIEKEAAWLLSYEENIEQGSDEVRTRLLVYDAGGIRLIRSGAMQMDVFFEKGSHYTSNMETPFGLMEFSVYTNEACASLEKDGGSLLLSYALSFNKREAISTKIEIEAEKLKGN